MERAESSIFIPDQGSEISARQLAQEARQQVLDKRNTHVDEISGNAKSQLYVCFRRGAGLAS